MLIHHKLEEKETHVYQLVDKITLDFTALLFILGLLYNIFLNNLVRKLAKFLNTEQSCYRGTVLKNPCIACRP